VEQPEGFIHRGLRAVLGGLRLAGYSAEVELVSAAELGAPHQRNRVFIIGHADYLSLQQRQGWKCWSESVRDDIETARKIGARSQTQPGVVRLDDGIPSYLAGLSYSGWWRHNLPPANPGLEGLSRKEAGARRQSINLYGRSICLPQAVIALMRLKFLSSLIEINPH
jgi:DNA (cytosine-5)-methyltransferase 1